jgi:hypothetical protein
MASQVFSAGFTIQGLLSEKTAPRRGLASTEQGGRLGALHDKGCIFLQESFLCGKGITGCGMMRAELGEVVDLES